MQDIGRLRTFALVCDLGSIAAAADVLGYTHSAVSQQLATLERETGLVLVDRSQRPLRPSPAGERLRPQVDGVLAAAGAAGAVAADLREGVTRLRVAAFPSALASFVPRAVRGLRRADPRLLVQVVQLETSEGLVAVREGRAEIAIVHRFGPLSETESAGLRTIPLLADGLHLVCARGHRLAGREELEVGDLEGEALILPRRDTPAAPHRALVERLCARAGFVAQVAYELDDLPAAQAFAAAGLAVVPMHGLTLTTLPRGAVARPLTAPEAERTVHAVVPAAGASEPAQALLDALVSVAGEKAAA